MKVENTKAQMRKGVLEYCILSVLAQGELYPSDIIVKLKEAKLIVVEGTLYPLLRRLEGQGLLRSEWLVTEDRPRRYYTLSTGGSDVLEKLVKEWQDLVGVVANVLPQGDLGKESKDK